MEKLKNKVKKKKVRKVKERKKVKLIKGRKIANIVFQKNFQFFLMTFLNSFPHYNGAMLGQRKNRRSQKLETYCFTNGHSGNILTNFFQSHIPSMIILLLIIYLLFKS